MVVALFPVAWLLPQRYWPPVARFLGRLHVGILGRRGRRLQPIFDRYLGSDAGDIELGFRTHNYRDLLAYLREHSPAVWRPEIRLHGREHIDEALEKGNGAVLWTCPSSYHSLLSKKAPCDAGAAIDHLIATTHGFSDTRLGVRFLNPIKHRIERRYVKEFCWIDFRKPTSAILRLMKLLRTNAVVSVSAVQTGGTVIEHTLFGGTLSVANGGPRMALSTGAALLPVFVSAADDGSFDVHIEPPLNTGADTTKTNEEDLVARYAPLLEKHIRQCPEVWYGWIGSENYWRPNG